jgi:putative sterol carrier protein
MMTADRFAAFLRAVSTSDAGESFADAYIVAAFETHDNAARIVIDTKSKTRDGAWFSVHVDDEDAPAAEVTFLARSETFDRVLRGDLGIMMAITTRKIVAEGTSRGSVPRAMRLVPAFEKSLPLYR